MSLNLPRACIYFYFFILIFIYLFIYFILVFFFFFPLFFLFPGQKIGVIIPLFDVRRWAFQISFYSDKKFLKFILGCTEQGQFIFAEFLVVFILFNFFLFSLLFLFYFFIFCQKLKLESDGSFDVRRRVFKNLLFFFFFFFTK